MTKQWRLIVYKAPPNQPLLHRLGLRPLRNSPTSYIGFYSDGAKPQLLRHVDMLRDAGLHGKAYCGSARKRQRPPRERDEPVMIDDAPFGRSYADLIIFAAKLRKNPTLAEKALWGHLAGRRLGVKVRRQRVLGGYIADFYISAWRLIIELDGSSHVDRGPYDQRRDDHLRSQGFRIIRFPNDLALNQPLTVVNAIIEFGRLYPPAPGSSASASGKVRSLTRGGGGSLGDAVRHQGRPMGDPSPRGPHSRTGSTTPKPHQGDVFTAAAHSERPKGADTGAA